MSTASRCTAGIVGVAIIGAVAHASVVASGGYGSGAALQIIPLAAALIAGSIALGVAWCHGHHLMAIALAFVLVVGEGVACMMTIERALAARAEQQAPIHARAIDRAAAANALADAERRLAETARETDRLRRALDAQVRLAKVVADKSAERGCAQNCRALLSQQVDAAAAEVAAARQEMDDRRQAAIGALSSARAAVAQLPPPLPASPLAEALGVSPRTLDIISAAMLSIALNGAGGLLLAFAVHLRPRDRSRSLSAGDHQELADIRDATREANRFAVSTYRPSHGGRVALADVRRHYREWCKSLGMAPLPDREIGRALHAIFEKAGLLFEDGFVIGIEPSQLLQAPQEASS